MYNVTKYVLYTLYLIGITFSKKFLLLLIFSFRYYFPQTVPILYGINRPQYYLDRHQSTEHNIIYYNKSSSDPAAALRMENASLYTRNRLVGRNTPINVQQVCILYTSGYILYLYTTDGYFFNSNLLNIYGYNVYNKYT